MHKNTKCILGNPSQQGKKTSQILCYTFQEKDLYHQEYPSTQEGAQNPRTLAPKRGAQLLPRSVLAEISKTHKCVCVSTMKDFPLLILDLSYQLKCLMAQQGRPHLDILFIINNY
jgi:hypothetical protein